MQPRKTRSLTPSRIVALTVIGLLVLGLGYLRFAPDARWQCRAAPRPATCP